MLLMNLCFLLFRKTDAITVKIYVLGRFVDVMYVWMSCKKFKACPAESSERSFSLDRSSEKLLSVSTKKRFSLSFFGRPVLFRD